MDELPEDLLADVLGRLPASSLAASRCVRKHWCSIIDARRLLRADLLPLRLDGFYCTSLDCIDRLTYFFARPAAARRVPGGPLEFLEDYRTLDVGDHCNGLLLLLGDMVVNPATQQWVNLPDFPEPSIGGMLGGVSVWAGTTTTAAADQAPEKNHDQDLLYPSRYLVYDPMSESPQHFEVFIVPLLIPRMGNYENITIDLYEQQWPPSTLRIHVFSSRRWRWEERSWIRQGEPAGTMADMVQSDCWDCEAVYFRQALYVRCQNDSVMRIALSSDTYQMMKSPATLSKLGAKHPTFYLGKSEKGVYAALLYWVDWSSYPQFRVWWLKEEEEINGGNHIIHMEWVLKTNISFPLLLANKLPLLHSGCADDEWRVIYNYNNKEEVPPAVAHGDDEFVADDEWDFDNADIVIDEAKDNKPTEADVPSPEDFLGFHPYKEIVFFSLRAGTISYNLNTSKVQRLGGSVSIPVGLSTSFPYTPCLLTLGELFGNS
ncbi:hypothetical protein ACP4OV_018210 [Aristida adscensionis]